MYSFSQPAFRDFPSFIQRSEQVKAQNFCPIRLVEPFNKRILRRLTRFDKLQCYTMLFGPLRRDIQINFNCQGFTVKVIHHVEGPEMPAADQRIMHKVYRPTLVKCLRRHQWRLVTYRQTLLSSCNSLLQK